MWKTRFTRAGFLCKFSMAPYHGTLLSVLLLAVMSSNLVQSLDEVEVNTISNENCLDYINGSFNIGSHVSISKDTYIYTYRAYNYLQSDVNEELLCPPWYYRKAGDQCLPGSEFDYIVRFEANTLQPWLQTFYCMTTTGENTTTRKDVIGSCLFSFDIRTQGTYYPLPCNITKLNEYTCGGLNREGQLCGRCVEGFAPAVFSYALNCVNCTEYHLNWLKYIGVAFGPLTLFCIMICVLHISVTSPYLHGYVFFCQIGTMPIVLRLVTNIQGYKEASTSALISKQIYLSLFSIWNLDIFRALYNPFCIHPNMTIIQALTLDYLIAFYPLVLLLVVFSLVSLHSKNNSVAVAFWKPFQKILTPCLRTFNIKTSLIESFATLYLLSVIKIQSVTLDLLSPTALYYVNGNINNKLFLFLAGDVEYFGTEHLPYGVLALTIFAVFVLFPAILLFLYPCAFFQRFLNRIQCNFHGLRTFVDVFQGHYKDGTNGTRDFRFFSGIFFITRLLLMASFVVLSSVYSILMFGTIITILAFAVATLHPQRTRIHYILDCIILLLFSLILFFVIGFLLGPHNSIPSMPSMVFGYAALAFPLIYFLCLVIYWIGAKKRVPQRLGVALLNAIVRCAFKKGESNEHQPLLT